MKVAELKKELKSRGLSVTGNKNELIERLQLSLMPTGDEDDSALLAEANDLLADDNEAKPEEKKKVSINRDSALPVATPVQEKAPEASEPAQEVPEPTPQVTPTGKKRSKITNSKSIIVKKLYLKQNLLQSLLQKEATLPQKRKTRAASQCQILKRQPQELPGLVLQRQKTRSQLELQDLGWPGQTRSEKVPAWTWRR